MTEYKFAKSEQ